MLIEVNPRHVGFCRRSQGFDQIGPDELTAVFALATRHGLTIYDASYVELAQRRQLPLATLDRKLREACAAAGVAALP